MGNNKITQISNNARRLHIDRKIIGILLVFTILGVCLVISIVVATSSLSALRGYASMQAHWTETRKEATMQLENYLRSGEEQYYSRFDSALAIIRSAEEIRHELLQEETNINEARKHFLKIHTNPADVDNMITTFKRFHEFPDFRDAIQQWINSENMVYEMGELAAQSRRQMQRGTFRATEKEAAIDRAIALDHKLTDSQYQLAAALSSGTHLLNTIILWISASLGLILLGIGGFFSFRFSKSLKSWRRAIELREQQYRSLFEQNPNAVYSFSTDGRFLAGNEALEEMIGYSMDELKGKKFEHLVSPSELETVREHFKKAAAGVPQTYEAIGVAKNNERIYTEITNLPIYVDEEIVGVYGIAHDITVRKEAELKVKEQLEEKTHLLSEIHDRVKNNLALISSLIQLKKETIYAAEQNDYLDSIISRIHSMAMVHEHLYHTDSFSSIRMDEYVRELGGSLETSFDKDCKVIYETSPVTLGIKKAIPTALLLNELLTNAFRFLPGDPGGKIEVMLAQENGQVVLQVVDNGPGLPEEYNLDDPETLGLRLVRVLIQQLQATFDLERENGTSFRITFSNGGQILKTA